MFNDKRSDEQMAADMLRVRGTQTAIMYGANLSHTQTQKYLRQLSEMGLIEKTIDETGGRTNGRPLYAPTGKGLEFLELVDRMEVLLGGRIDV